MKKLRVVLPAVMLLFSMLVLLASCGGGATIERGAWQGGVYTNESLGLTFTLPQGWDAASEAELAELAEITRDLLGESFADAWENETLESFTEMQAVNPNTGTNVNIVITRTHGRVPSLERLAREAADGLVEELEEVDLINITTPVVDSSATRIGANDWWGYSYEMDFFGMMTMYGHQFVRVANGASQVITITRTEASTMSVQDILAMFDTP